MIAALLSVSAFLPQQTRGEVYRWVDESGQVHYSDRPPAVEAEAYSVPPPNAAQSDPAAVKNFYEEQRRKREEREAKRAEQSAQRQLAAEQCDQARERLKLLDERPPNRLMVTGPDGQPARMTTEQWNERRAKAQAGIDKNCV